MTEKGITIKISKDGEIELDTKGYKDKCKDIIGSIGKALSVIGEQKSLKYRDEVHDKDEKVVAQANQY